MHDSDEPLDGPPIATGMPGIDDILRGGLPPDCLYMIAGTPGSGKTTLGMQFLLEGVRRGEPLENFHGVLTGIPTLVVKADEPAAKRGANGE